jgi:hypothetical protein
MATAPVLVPTGRRSSDRAPSPSGVAVVLASTAMAVAVHLLMTDAGAPVPVAAVVAAAVLTCLVGARRMLVGPTSRRRPSRSRSHPTRGARVEREGAAPVR